MSYIRVIPRDLFNEANLLKCVGALYIALDEKYRGSLASFGEADIDGVDSFDIQQSMDDGSTYVANLPLTVNGELFDLTRPLNSREPWPLYVTSQADPDFEDFRVFNDDGTLTGEFLEFIGKPA